jgi:hypothetical protein
MTSPDRSGFGTRQTKKERDEEIIAPSLREELKFS